LTFAPSLQIGGNPLDALPIRLGSARIDDVPKRVVGLS
jgi:hypothetical protein